MILLNADVAELADAQVSEACDGDIVEVQVLSSAPFFKQNEASPLKSGSFHFFLEPSFYFGTRSAVVRI